MKNKLLATVGASALALSLSMGVAQAGNGYLLPGETMGVSLDSPLPEGVFAFDLESYGKADGSQTRVGVNIPGIIWSTPWSFYNFHLEILAVFPFAHLNGGGVNATGAITQAYGPILGYDFGNGFTGGISAFVRTPDPTTGGPLSVNNSGFVNHNVAAGDFRESLQYVGPILGIPGMTVNENGYYNTDFRNSANPYTNDLLGGDFSIQKTFDKLSIGFTGFGSTGLEKRVLSGGRVANVELGGIVSYDFGRFSLRGMVTRSVLNTTNGVHLPGSYETRGWLVATVPLYVAPKAAPVVARY